MGLSFNMSTYIIYFKNNEVWLSLVLASDPEQEDNDLFYVGGPPHNKVGEKLPSDVLTTKFPVGGTLQYNTLSTTKCWALPSTSL